MRHRDLLDLAGFAALTIAAYLQWSAFGALIAAGVSLLIIRQQLGD